MGKVIKCDHSLITLTSRFAKEGGFQLESTSFINDSRTTGKKSDGTAWDSRGNTLTFHTFRPDGAAANGRVVSPRLPPRSAAIGNPHSPGYEPNAYRPSVGYPYTSKHTHRHPSPDYPANGYHQDVGPRRFYYSEDDILVKLEGDEMRVGFAMSGGADEQQTSLINNILPGSPADRAGLSIGDEIIEVNGVPVERSNHAEIVQLIHRCIKSRTIQLRVRRKHDQRLDDLSELSGCDQFHSDDDSQTACSKSSLANGEARVTDAYLVSVDKDQKRDVEKKLKRNYPGVKTYDMETVAARELPPNSPRPLAPAQPHFNGQMNGDGPSPLLNDQAERLRQYEEDLRRRRQKSEQRAKEQEFLRTSLRGSKKLQSLANGKAATDDEDDDDASGKGYANESYVPGDNSLREEVAKREQQEAIPLEQVIVSVNRVADQLQREPGREEDSKFLRQYFTQAPIQNAIQAAAVHRSASKEQATTSAPLVTTKGELKIIKLLKADDSYLGATVRNDGERVIVGRVVKGGIAEKSRLLQEGDEIIEVNGTDLRGKSVTEVCDMLRSITGEVTFVIAPCEESKSAARQPGSKGPAPVVQHMRAMFDYEPEDDFYVPCKELALKFQKGDILHVISMADQNWWQAYREGDDPNQNLAGLIPSASFQQQVIQYNREIEKESEPTTGAGPKTDKQLFGCAKKSKERKKKNQKVTVFGGTKEVRPLDEVIAENDDEIFTYEEVSLYLSRTGRKRPIVLCGPEGVGCLELRQKLMEFDKDKYAGVVPHTSRPKRSGEQDGVHYHFVSKQSFQEDSRLGKFIEWGEYQKHYYGTSFGAVKTVVERGKTCLLTLKAQSLKALRSSDLLPYVVFVSPPALQQLKRQKEKQGLHSVRDEELKAILQEGKRIETQYGHYFDKIIINVDLDRSFSELKETVHRLETEPQWVPSVWLAANNSLARS